MAGFARFDEIPRCRPRGICLLQHPPAGAAHLLATSPLDVSAGSAKLDQPDLFASGGPVDTTLATHGVLKSFTMSAK